MANGLRALPDAEVAAKVAELHEVACEEARAVLERLRNVTRLSAQRPNGVAPVLAAHLDVRGLAGSIFRHAMIHGRMLLDESGPFERCPQCGESLQD